MKKYENIASTLTNHPKDRHVLAAAVACRADYLVTFNVKYFRARPAVARKTGIIGPSTFLSRLLTLDPEVVEQRLREQAAAILQGG